MEEGKNGNRRRATGDRKTKDKSEKIKIEIPGVAYLTPDACSPTPVATNEHVHQLSFIL